MTGRNKLSRSGARLRCGAKENEAPRDKGAGDGPPAKRLRSAGDKGAPVPAPSGQLTVYERSNSSDENTDMDAEANEQSPSSNQKKARPQANKKSALDPLRPGTSEQLGRAAVGHRVRVYWPAEMPPDWFEGTIKDYSPASNEHYIVYDDKDHRHHDLLSDERARHVVWLGTAAESRGSPKAGGESRGSPKAGGESRRSPKAAARSGAPATQTELVVSPCVRQCPRNAACTKPAKHTGNCKLATQTEVATASLVVQPGGDEGDEDQQSWVDDEQQQGYADQGEEGAGEEDEDDEEDAADDEDEDEEDGEDSEDSGEELYDAGVAEVVPEVEPAPASQSQSSSHEKKAPARARAPAAAPAPKPPKPQRHPRPPPRERVIAPPRELAPAPAAIVPAPAAVVPAEPATVPEVACDDWLFLDGCKIRINVPLLKEGIAELCHGKLRFRPSTDVSNPQFVLKRKNSEGPNIAVEWNPPEGSEAVGLRQCWFEVLEAAKSRREPVLGPFSEAEKRAMRERHVTRTPREAPESIALSLARPVEKVQKRLQKLRESVELVS